MRYEFNRPFVEAKDYQENDALSVEATGYALQTIFLMEGGGVTFTQVGRIMKENGSFSGSNSVEPYLLKGITIKVQCLLYVLGPKLFFVTGLVIFVTAEARLVCPNLLG